MKISLISKIFLFSHTIFFYHQSACQRILVKLRRRFYLGLTNNKALYFLKNLYKLKPTCFFNQLKVFLPLEVFEIFRGIYVIEDFRRKIDLFQKNWPELR